MLSYFWVNKRSANLSNVFSALSQNRCWPYFITKGEWGLSCGTQLPKIYFWRPVGYMMTGLNQFSTRNRNWFFRLSSSCTGSDNLVVIWNAGTGEPTIVIDCHPDLIYSASWNWDGSKLLTTCKDKKIRIINPRSGIVEEVNPLIFLLLY